MTDLNVDDFHRDLALALNRLYQQFPRPLALYVEDIAGADEVDEYGLHSARHQACFATLMWMAEENLIRHTGAIRQEALDQVTLTGTAFTLLSLPTLQRQPHDVTGLPASVREEQSTNIHRLREALEDGSSARVRKVMVELLARQFQVPR